MTAHGHLVEISDLYKTYLMGDVKVPVLRGVSLKIERGEFVALVGASGSGKSTLMNILGCLDRPTKGQYRFNGSEVSNLSPDQRADLRNREIGFVFQNFNLLPRTSALENVLVPLFYSRRPSSPKEEENLGRSLLEKVGLADRLEHQPSQLSGGQQQRVAIARALINQPALILADEPTGNLDTHTSSEIMNMFQELNRDQGITVLIVTHNLEICNYAKRIIKMRDGLIEQD